MHYLLFLADSDPGLDVGEGMHGGEHGVPAVLFMQQSPGPPLQGEGGGVHEPPEVEVLLEVGHPVFHLILIEVRLHKSDLDVGLGEGRGEGMGRDEPATQSKRRTVPWRGMLGQSPALLSNLENHQCQTPQPGIQNLPSVLSTLGKEQPLRLWKGQT